MAQALDTFKATDPSAGPVTPAERVARRKALLNWIAVHALGVAAALFFVLPFVFLFLTSLMSDQQALTRDLWPHPFEWSNYRRVFDTPGFLTWWKNTLLYAGLGTVLTVVSSLPVAYALAKFRFRGRQLSLMLVISMMMLPPQVVVIPMYLFWAKQLDMSGTLWPLIIPMVFGDAFSIFLLRQFLLTIPNEYLDAAKVDGCGELRALLKVVVPMARPGIAAVALFQFFYAWNDYFGPQIYASENPAAWTLSYGLESFKGAHHTDWNLTMAATVLVMAPVILVFFFAQKAFVEGVTLTGVKG
ncbi:MULTISPECIES: carbohydrate ABC transporter permease [unclassified Streptomyces]|uniref:carbohydrate ABC transporter permease n=1 Tax=unclassified Streptomyces TaxID=2593676 RepID=UPI002250DA22|nr:MULTISPECIES: carbohydrate ABC transporter permease [unclassified Streptomyces]WSF86726.1 carbohydrate ABC transporter permease [Streptomyces sp. NBC_01744]MCX5313098.1 carbohydrate ABC transporter permease [Streptomyces sp. NBC_00154]WSC45134.1 carbohydrate ABC transporter permease [Streptomyces sp. NBC_01762]WSC55879.1 carbohydrate ABC transporter permease [Streptomyces sp. NBC_01761]WSD24794.1 carbohydrate ABC transporter permease [Streptomyces sp. NBC_01751]